MTEEEKKIIDNTSESDNPEVPEHDTPPVPPIPLKKPRNQRLKSENPKNRQFTGRATEKQYQIINQALAARKKQLGLSENEPYDIVMFALDSIKYHKNDILSSFKVK